MIFLKKTISAQLHLIGCLAAAVGLYYLLFRSAQHPDQGHFWACFVYGFTGIALFAISSIYHFLHDGVGISAKWEHRFEHLDHLAIYSFIAGSYTVILLNTVKGSWINFMLIAAWAIALMGITYTLIKSRLPGWAQHRFLYTGLFLMMGWLVIIRIGEVFSNLWQHSLLLPFVLGTLCYSVGAVIYATKWPTLFKNVFGFHEIWHALVLAGFGFHLYVVFGFYPLV